MFFWGMGIMSGAIVFTTKASSGSVEHVIVSIVRVLGSCHDFPGSDGQATHCLNRVKADSRKVFIIIIIFKHAIGPLEGKTGRAKSRPGPSYKGLCLYSLFACLGYRVLCSVLFPFRFFLDIIHI